MASTAQHNGHAVRALFARSAAILRGFSSGGLVGGPKPGLAGERVTGCEAFAGEFRLPRLHQDVAQRHGQIPAVRVFQPEACMRREVDRLCRLYGVAFARTVLEAGLDQARLNDAAARDHAQTVRLAQAEAEVGL